MCQFYLRRHVAIRVRWESLHAKIALVGHEDRLEGEGRWPVGVAKHLQLVASVYFAPHPAASRIFPAKIVETLGEDKLIPLHDIWINVCASLWESGMIIGVNSNHSDTCGFK